MTTKNLESKLLHSWVKLSTMIKNTRITKGLKYNESIVMLIVYNRYLADGEGLTSIKDIISETGMLKSLVNRTVTSLCKKGLVTQCNGIEDKRTRFIKCVEKKLDVFLDVHNTSLGVAKDIVSIIGEKDTQTFIEIVNKLSASGYKC